MRRALFVDRDGVINIDHGYVYRPSDFQVIDGVFDALRLAQARNYALIIVTNQSGIARGLFSVTDYRRLEDHMHQLFAKEGIRLTAIYHCPHHPDGTVQPFAIQCACRKPQPGMILKAAEEHAIDLAGSVMVGDKETDAQAAFAAGITNVHTVCFPELRLVDVFV